MHAADVTIGDKLQELQGRLHVLDVRSPESISAFAAQLEGKRIDVLLNVAGVMVSHIHGDKVTTACSEHFDGIAPV